MALEALVMSMWRAAMRAPLLMRMPEAINLATGLVE